MNKVRRAQIAQYTWLYWERKFGAYRTSGRCLSVDEPILGSTPALAILGSLTTPTPKYSLTIAVLALLQ